MGEVVREPLYENLATIFERVRVNISKRTQAPEFPFGLTLLDKATHGIRRGKLTLVASRTSEGKTSFSLQMAMRLADSGKVVAFISLEDDREQIAEKIYCNLFQEDNYSVMRGVAKKIDDPAVNTLFKTLKLLVIDNFGFTFDEIRHVVEELDPKPDVIFLDYIQIIQSNGNRYEAMNEFTADARRYSVDQDIAFVITSQINRHGARDSRPQLHHLSGSDTLEQCADLILLMYYPYIYKDPTFNYDSVDGVTVSGYDVAPKNWIEVEVAKNKTGERGIIIPLQFTGRHYAYHDWAGRPES